MVKVNLGSGFIGLEGWLNYDNSVVAKLSRHKFLLEFAVKVRFLPESYLDIKWPPIIARDCRKRIPLESDSVDFIYTSHFLEHLYRYETVAILKECRRILKDNGTIRIALPDISKIINALVENDKTLYLERGSVYHEKDTQSDYFVSNFYPLDLNQREAPTLKTKFQELFLRRHKWMYSVESMKSLLLELGFKNVEEKEYQQSDLDEVTKLDVHPSETFYLEAGI